MSPGKSKKAGTPFLKLVSLHNPLLRRVFDDQSISMGVFPLGALSRAFFPIEFCLFLALGSKCCGGRDTPALKKPGPTKKGRPTSSLQKTLV